MTFTTIVDNEPGDVTPTYYVERAEAPRRKRFAMSCDGTGLNVRVVEGGAAIIVTQPGSGRIVAHFGNYVGYWAKTGYAEPDTDGFALIRVNEWLYALVQRGDIKLFQTFADEEIERVYYVYEDGEGKQAPHIIALTASYAIVLPQMLRYAYQMPVGAEKPTFTDYVDLTIPHLGMTPFNVHDEWAVDGLGEDASNTDFLRSDGQMFVPWSSEAMQSYTCKRL